MREKSREKKAVRTVRRKKAKDLLAVLSFLFLLPYTCSLLSGARLAETAETEQQANSEKGAEDETPTVLWEQENGAWEVPLEEFVTGTLAASVPIEYHAEVQKAQAVLLRSRVAAGMADTKGSVTYRRDGETAYLDEAARRALWGSQWEEYEAVLKQAVQGTKGIVLTWENKVVSPPFFRLSAGQTRDGREIFDGQQFIWCRSVPCAHDIESAEFLQEKRWEKDAFCKRLKQEGFLLPGQDARIVLTRDSAGYVTSVVCQDSQMEGERFRKLFDLASACFSLREEQGEIILQTKGVGHGLGFDQYAANRLAEEGMDYIGLLDHFFDGLTLEKME